MPSYHQLQMIGQPMNGDLEILFDTLRGVHGRRMFVSFGPWEHFFFEGSEGKLEFQEQVHLYGYLFVHVIYVIYLIKHIYHIYIYISVFSCILHLYNACLWPLDIWWNVLLILSAPLSNGPSQMRCAGAPLLGPDERNCSFYKEAICFKVSKAMKRKRHVSKGCKASPRVNTMIVAIICNIACS